jgi:hypothetical protein
MTDQEALPVKAEAGADVKGPALQIHEDAISCAASAAHQLSAGAFKVHVQQLSQLFRHNEINDSTLPLVVVLVMWEFHAQTQR